MQAASTDAETAEQPAADTDTASADAAAPVDELEVGQVADVEELRGVRVNVDEAQQPVVEYLVHWKGNHPDTWEPVANLAENLLRDYEDRWWKASKEGDEEGILKMLSGGRRVLVHSVDENRRSALHFAAATRNLRICRILCEAGAEVDLRDKDGYTPLHMAAGYLHTQIVDLLLYYGADPEIRDRENRSVLGLVDSLKTNIPNDPSSAQRRFALEKCGEILTATLYDELEPRQLLDSRKNEDGSRDFLVQWPDDSPDSWVSEREIAQDVIMDFEAQLEYAEAEAILRMIQRGDQRQFLVRWSDGYPDSWEDEENVSPELIAEWAKTAPPLPQSGNAPRKQKKPAAEKKMKAAAAAQEPVAAGSA